MLRNLNTAVVILALLSYSSSSFSQSAVKKDVSSYFDKTIGDELSNSNNGKIHIDPYHLKNDDNYYIKNYFVNGSIFYNDQLYENVLLKYDIYKDQLVKSFQYANSFGITLTSEKLDYFILYNKTFINIDTKYKFPKTITGFFEEKYLGKKACLYIKHFKTAKEVISESTLDTEFKEHTDYQLLYESKFWTINTSKEILSIFPQLKSEIKDYYKTNKRLEEANPDQFKADLIKLIDNNLQSATPKI